MTMRYTAEVRARSGALLFRTAETYKTRDDAAAAAFVARPGAKTCSTHYGFGLDIRWHSRRNFKDSIAKLEAHNAVR